MVTKKGKVAPNIRPEDMRVFAAIATARTLTEASEALKIPLFTASRALKRIELAAQLVLLRRDGFGMHLTEVGQEYLKACQTTLQAHKAAMEVLVAPRAEPEGILHVVAPVPFVQNVLSRVLSEFLDSFPKLRVKVSLYTDWNEEPNASHDVFLKFRVPRESRYQMKLFPPIRQGLFASPLYLANHPGPMHPTDLENHECLASSETNRPEYWKFWQKGEHVSIAPNPRISISDPRSLARLAIDSAGLTVLPLWLARKHVEAGALVSVLTGWTVDPLMFCGLYNGPLRAASKESAFLCFLAAILGTAKDPRCSGADPKAMFVHGDLELNADPPLPAESTGKFTSKSGHDPIR